MASFVFSTPAVLANGCQLTCAVSGGTWASIVIDQTKVTLTCVRKGYDNTKAAVTRARTLSLRSATFSGGTMTFNLDGGPYGPCFQPDTTVLLALTAGAVTSGTDTNTALTSTAVDNTANTLPYPNITVWKWNRIPHEYYAGGIVPLPSLGGGPSGVACVEKGITQALTITTDASGIAGTGLVFPGTLNFSGGGVGKLAPGTDLTIGAGVRTIRVFMISGSIPVAAETGAEPEAPGSGITVASTAGGEVLSTVVTAMTDRVCAANGPAPIQDEWNASLTATKTDDYQRWRVAYPFEGDTPFDSRTASLISAVNATDGQRCRGDEEIFCDGAGTEATKLALMSPIFTDYTSSATCTGSSGTFGPGEFCKITTAGSLSAIVEAWGANSAGTQSATPFRYGRLAFGCVAYTMTLALDPVGGTPAYGNLMVPNGTFTTGTGSITGFILSYNAGTKTITYILMHGTNFAAADAVKLVTRDGILLGITLTAVLPVAVGTTVSSGDVVTGFVSAATCTLSGAPAANGSDSNNGLTAGAPLATQQKALTKFATQRGDSRADGGVIYVLYGPAWPVYNAGNDTETRSHYVTIMPAPGVPKSLSRQRRYDTGSTNGNDTNFIKLKGMTMDVLSAQGGVNNWTVGSSGSVAGNYDRPAFILDDCKVEGFFRWQLGGPLAWATSNAPFYAAAINCYIERCGLSVHFFQDCYFTTFSNDIFTLARAVVNCKVDDCNSTNTLFHTDIEQYQATETFFSLVWGLVVTNITGTQIAPFCNAATGTATGILMVNCFQADDGTADLGQLGNANGAGTVTFKNIVFIFCTFGDGIALRASAVGRNSAFENLYAKNCIFSSFAFTDTGTITVFRAGFDNNHYFTTPGSLGSNETSGSTFAAEFVEPTNNSDPGFMRPKAGSTLLNRVTTPPNGFPTRDAFGRKLSTDATAKPAVGAAQPIPTISVTLGTVAFTDGSSHPLLSNSTPQSLVITNGGPTGSVLEVASVVGGGGLTSSGSGNAIAGASPSTVTVSVTVGTSPGTETITYGPTTTTFSFTATWVSSTTSNPSARVIAGSMIEFWWRKW